MASSLRCAVVPVEHIPGMRPGTQADPVCTVRMAAREAYDIYDPPTGYCKSLCDSELSWR
jgi:hypothetical protein